MTTIATFTKTENGYIGAIHTLALKSKLTLSPADNTKGKAPDFRVIAEDGIEIGGAWKRKSKSGNAYLSVRLDDPSFTAPVYANLVERDGQHLLIWNR
ncbi:DUF736 family protein [Altererythrobacter indicus]|uniref:DUF736 family protein n=1 Tax=Altericroceibacterium indicum TaxID=374177 RepID=A0A845AB86_9SPHN|nr:DUF736 domain-containing protein [Altericroceibacterium indicum]MXP24438.1 DUF736 family protein [Altericroceibacterium indicum]